MPPAGAGQCARVQFVYVVCVGVGVGALLPCVRGESQVTEGLPWLWPCSTHSCRSVRHATCTESGFFERCEPTLSQPELERD